MTLIKHKKVELTELFYDLVFVYAISQITTLIHHVHHGIVIPYAFFTFVIALIIFVNSWMVQTVFTNRFGQNSLTNILFMFAQMLCLLISSTAVTEEWSTSFVPFILPMAFISLLLLLQYVIEYFNTKVEADRDLIRQYFYILGIRSLTLFVSIFLPYQFGLILAVSGVLLTWILPGILTNPKQGHVSEKTRAINFPHLVERLSLLVIITFGEMIIGIAPYFSVDNLSVASFLIFIIVTNLFMIYIVEIDHMIEVNQDRVTGNGAIYYHYPIFLGLSLITVSLSFLGNQAANNLFSICLLYLGILLLLFGVFAHQHYNKSSHQFTNKLYWGEFGMPILGLLLSFLTLQSAFALIVIACLVTLIMMIVMISFNLKRI
ncbi:low temperature requirement protein A [Streptococcus gallolyticus subsp. gallolyticus]|uniref:low temperature requirement protein A n=1 Tax=Streptococcus gallolyticus TaxID=315405 RepID=UPI000201B089|nr:low temperature requirement protein A [Streptococcus gallolyticus]MCF1635448.1 low temperature requirement protein A [Streptococcus gallolyticus]MCY7178737.1 low temperature requirement protein A [Streptococcus gallolyticus subsp. gallolyticus]MCY7191024.1 low temperature requirement protein A [Streptococcus gallolyticus subsp. gallolyticus]MCY7193318.1 low temperature requirement protein A [Streptococcus gallolyticus subsp. gallolyticus]MCY7202065.1 low temperature requirement protein A [S